MPSLARIRRLSPQEVSWRVSTLGRATRDRAIAVLRPPRWDREALWTALAAHLPRPGHPSDSESAWLAVNEELVATLRGRRARFVIDPTRLPEIRDEVLKRFPDAALEATARAERIAIGRFDLLGYRAVSFVGSEGRVDWHADPVHGRRAPQRFWSHIPYLDPSVGDHKIIWELNRHQHWLALGRALWLTDNPVWGSVIVGQLRDWLSANPPLIGINWASMLELAFRSLSWLSALHLLIGRDDVVPDRPWLVDLLVGLDRQLHHVERNLSHYFSPNTHLTGEALALYAVGSALPELAASTRWIDTGRAILLREIDRQIADDGGHAERATHYHRYTLDFYVLAALIAEVNGDVDASARFTDAVVRLAHFMRAVADDAGRIPHVGDDDGGLLWPICAATDDDVRASLTLAAAVAGRPDLAPWPAPEEALWIGWSARDAKLTASDVRWRDAAASTSQLFPETGFAVMRDGHGHHLLFDVGPHGYLNGGHAHADALAITLSVGGVQFLVDAGTATYTVDAKLRDRLRSSESHNTVTVDGRSAAEPAGPFHWHTRADAALATWRANDAFSWAEAAHAGYGPLRHRRSVVAARGNWVILDEVIDGATTGETAPTTDPHRADVHWHFHPEWLVHCEDGQRLFATHDGGRSMWLLHDGGNVWLTYGDDESGLGWWSPQYGALAPTWAARVSRSGTLPFSILTWIGDADAGGIGHDLPTLERVPIDVDSAATAIGLRVRDGLASLFTAIRPGDDAGRHGRHTAIGVYASDARLLQYATAGDRVTWLALADVTHATAADNSLSVVAEAHVIDLAVSVEDHQLSLHSSGPVAVWLHGRALTRPRRILLNGREWTSGAGADGELRVPASAWAGKT